MDIDNLLVHVNQGTLRGIEERDLYGNTFRSFLGIPYAQPPLGDLRFKAPKPAESWSGILDATSYKCDCPSIFDQHQNTSEDCLYLNVYTPQKCSSEKLPVIYFIHGGAFITGSSHRDEYGPDFLMSKNVVLVTATYRVGVLGFLSSKIPELDMPGNAGLKDMRQVLRWIQENVAHFGGDPANVTLCGASAGAVCAHLLMLSASTKGLFHKVILQSGCALVDWLHIPWSDTAFFKKLGVPSVKPPEITEFLKSVKLSDLFTTQKYFYKLTDLWGCEYRAISPIIEGDTPDALWTEEPENVLKAGRAPNLPLIIGYLPSDGSAVSMFKSNLTSNMTDFRHYVNRKLRNQIKSESVLWHLGEQIMHFYYGNNQKPHQDNIKGFYDVCTDVAIAYPLNQAAKLHAQIGTAPVYYYKFTRKSKLSANQDYIVHSDETRYLFSAKITSGLVELRSPEEDAINLMCTMWANFAKTASPNPIPTIPTISWLPATNINKMAYLDIGNELCLKYNPDHERFFFWDQIYNYISDMKFKL